MKTNLNVDTQALREKILDLAMRGKLVKQDAGDEPASVLLEKIKAEKAELVKEGKIKKSKKLPEITDDEKPFDIPDSWEWVRLGDVCTKLVDGDHNPPKGEKIKTEYIMASSRNINRDTLVDLDVVRYLDEDTFNKENERTMLQKGDILFTSVGSLGRSCIYEGDLNICFQRSVSVLTTQIFNQYLKYFFDSPYYQKTVTKHATGTAQKGFYLKQMAVSLIAVPPLAEQKRIADKVSELFKQVNAIEKNVAEYQDLERAMRSKLLDLAMRGKLVDQDPSDEPASELLKQIQAEKAELVKEGKIKKSKKLPKITDDEKPFDIPDSWEWVRFNDLFDIGSAMRIHQSDWEDFGIPFFRGRELVRLVNTGDPKPEVFISEELYEEKKSKGGVPNKGDLLVSAVGTLGKVYIVQGIKRFYYKDAYILRFFNFSKLDPQYFKYVLDSPFEQRTIRRGSIGSTVSQLTIREAKKLLCPFPPLAEQKRIADKLTRLFEDLDTIKQNLATVS